jgi:hypothetical protein
MDQYDALYVKWGNYLSVDPAIPKAMTVVESGGVDLAGGEPGSIGILQIMPRYWNDTATTFGVDLGNPEGQIAVCCAILSGQSGHGDFDGWENNFRTLYFPHDDPYTGITQDEYVAWIKKGVELIHDAPQHDGNQPQVVAEHPFAKLVLPEWWEASLAEEQPTDRTTDGIRYHVARRTYTAKGLTPRRSEPKLRAKASGPKVDANEKIIGERIVQVQGQKGYWVLTVDGHYVLGSKLSPKIELELW